MAVRKPGNPLDRARKRFQFRGTAGELPPASVAMFEHEIALSLLQRATLTLRTNVVTG